MKFKIKNYHFILFAAAAIIALRFELFIDTFKLLYLHFNIAIDDFSFALNQLDFELFDIYFSVILLLLMIAHFIFRKIKGTLASKINFTSPVIILLGFFFLFAPMITNINPDFQKNLSVTKLLPPLSVVKIIHLKDEDKNENIENEFINLKYSVAKRSFNKNIILADSVRTENSELIYFQKERKKKIDLKELKIKNNEPYISNRMFLLGTDHYGRDTFARLVYGTRISLMIGICAVAIAFIIGLLLGFAAGYPGGFFDSLISRFTDMFLSFPAIFLIVLALALFGSSIFSVIIVLGFSGWMSLFKVVRGEIISIKNKDYFAAAKLLGISKRNLLFKEILPIIIVPIIVNLVLLYGNVILAEAALSYLGLGTGGEFPSWGAMINAGQNYITKAWWMIFFPGLALFLTLFAANNLGTKIKNYFNPFTVYDK